MKSIIAYLLIWLAGIFGLWSLVIRGLTPEWLTPYNQVIFCSLFGALGCIVYCLRGIYLNRAINKGWDANWNVWYYLRPVVSIITGGISYIFLKAGLLVLDAQTTDTHNAYGFYALAFIAGLNVDRFLKKIEKVAETAWGINPSRASSEQKEIPREK